MTSARMGVLLAFAVGAGACRDDVVLGSARPIRDAAADASARAPVDASAADALSLVGLSVLLVTGTSDAALAAGDDRLAAHLSAAGLDLRRADHFREPVTLTPAPAFVVLSSSVDSASLPASLVETSLPIVTMENYLCGRAGMSGPNEGPDFGIVFSGSLDVQDAPPGEAIGRGPVVVNTDQMSRMGYCVPASTARVVARAADHVVFFGYERDAPMVVGRAPGRRIVVFLRTEASSGATVDGWRLFDAALRWAARP